MKVFISWSGELSRELGEAIRNWLPSVLQVVRPYFTPNDIEKGARWGTHIASELQESEIGVFCLTRDNLESPWIMFEAGAISKVVGDTCVCPILFDLEPSDISGPLSQFQLTQFKKSDIRKLIGAINTLCGEQKLDDAIEEQVFEMWWPKLEEQITKILEKYKDVVKEEVRTDRELLEEVLSYSRLMVKQVKEQQKIEWQKVMQLASAILGNVPEVRGLSTGNLSDFCDKKRNEYFNISNINEYRRYFREHEISKLESDNIEKE